MLVLFSLLALDVELYEIIMYRDLQAEALVPKYLMTLRASELAAVSRFSSKSLILLLYTLGSLIESHC